MTITEQITEDMKSSMKAGDAHRTGVLRLLRSSFKNEQIKLGHELSDAETLKVLQREAKQRRESAEVYRANERAEQAAAEESELEVIASYLPQPLTEAELAAIVDEVVGSMDNPQPSAMGQVIGAVMAKVGARADGGAVSKVVRERLR